VTPVSLARGLTLGRSEVHSSKRTTSGRSQVLDTRASNRRKRILLRTPVDRVGRLPNLAGGPAGPATHETLHCCDVHNHA